MRFITMIVGALYVGNNTEDTFKSISLISLVVGVAIWAWYILFIMILNKVPHGQILLTIPIGILGTVSGLIAKERRLIVLNIMLAVAFPIIFFIAL